jgi:hypothetical protein
VLKLSAAAGLVDFFQPPTWRADDAADLDLASTGPVFVGSDLFVLGKQHTAFLLDPASPGGASHETPIASLPDVCTAFGANAVIGSSIFVACSTGVRQLIANTTGSPSLTTGWSTLIRANGPVAVGANTVWSIDKGGQYLYGYAPSDGHVTFRASVPLDPSQHFPTPTVTGQTLLVESHNHVMAFSV